MKKHTTFITTLIIIFLCCNVKAQAASDITEQEIEYIARIVHYEAQNQDEHGKRLVADTLLNRKCSSQYPNTITEVAKQNRKGIYQYSVVAAGVLDDPDCCATEEERKLVREEIEHPLDERVIFFQTKKYSPYGKDLYKHGDHYFSTLKEGL